MAIYQIDYDLRKQRHYDALYKRIRNYPNWCRPLESTWIIKAPSAAIQVRDQLAQGMDKDDGLVVTRLSGEAAWCGLSDKVAEWLRHELARGA